MICGIDEAGRGCVAGSLFMVAVVLDSTLYDSFAMLGIKDSKQLNFHKRNALEKAIKDFLESSNGAYKIVSFSASDIDSYSLATCLHNGLQELYNFAMSLLAKKVIFDGNTNFGIKGISCMIKGDSKHALISAASVLAKCSKDREMLSYHEAMPHFDFKHNKGYLTKDHKHRIKQYGLSSIHRHSYKIILDNRALF